MTVLAAALCLASCGADKQTGESAADAVQSSETVTETTPAETASAKKEPKSEESDKEAVPSAPEEYKGEGFTLTVDSSRWRRDDLNGQYRIINNYESAIFSVIVQADYTEKGDTSKTVGQSFEQQYLDLKDEGFTKVSNREMKFDGRDAYEMVLSQNRDGLTVLSTNIVVCEGTKVTMINYARPKGSAVDSEYKAILDSFKFV